MNYLIMTTNYVNNVEYRHWYNDTNQIMNKMLTNSCNFVIHEFNSITISFFSSNFFKFCRVLSYLIFVSETI